jgi:hypothetical protein
MILYTLIALFIILILFYISNKAISIIIESIWSEELDNIYEEDLEN